VRRVGIGDDGPVRDKAGHIAPGMCAGGGKELPGPWLERNEGAEFRPRVINGLENRGAEDGPIALLDGLKGFPEAITAVFPRATVQTGIVRRLRRGLDFLSRKDRRPVAAALKDTHRALDAEAGDAAPGAFAASLRGRKYPATAGTGGAPGPRSSRSRSSPPRCVGFCMRPMPWKRSIPSRAGPSGPEVVSPATRRPPSSSSRS
jgi:transposase-like protein